MYEEEEKWIDVINYDGIYEVSNFGRIKSLERYVNGGHGNQRFVKERILSQHEVKGMMTVHLSFEGKGKSFIVSNIVYLSFNKNSPLKPNEVIMHIDKKLENNYLSNLKITTCKESVKQNFLKGKSTIGKITKSLDKANCVNRIFYQNRTHKTCNCCAEEKEIIFFVKDRLLCKKCYNKKMVEKRKLNKLKTPN